MSVIIVVFQLIAQVCECCDNARWNKRTSLRVKTCVQAFEKTLVRMRDSGTRNPASDSHGRLRSGVDLFGRASRGHIVVFCPSNSDLEL